MVEHLVRCCMAFPISLKHRLRGKRIKGDYYGVLTSAEISELDAVANVPLHLCCKMSQLLNEAVGSGALRPSDQYLVEALVQELLERRILAAAHVEEGVHAGLAARHRRLHHRQPTRHQRQRRALVFLVVVVGGGLCVP